MHTTAFQTKAAIDFVMKQLEKPVNQKSFTELMVYLELAQKNCQDETLNQILISLYGKIVEKYNLYVKKKVQEIAKLSLDPSVSPSSLKRKILQFKNTEGLSKENFDILSTLRQNPKKLTEFSIPLLFGQKKGSLEEIENLFELAAAVYYSDDLKTRNLLQQLSSKVTDYLLENSSFPMHKIPFLQKLFLLIYQLAEKPPTLPLSEKEIMMFFTERAKIIQEDLCQMPRIIPFARPA